MPDRLVIKDEGEGKEEESLFKLHSSSSFFFDNIVPYGLLVWSTGLMQNPLVASLEIAKDAKKQRYP
jgi:hypothetical protein